VAAVLHSVWTGAVSTSSVTISTRLSGSTGEEGDVSIKLATDEALTQNVVWSDETTSVNRIARHTITNLAADTQYYYAVALDGVPSSTVTGQFKTLNSGAFSFRFAAGSCADTGSTHAVFDAIRTNGTSPLFFIHMGDFHYSDLTTSTDETRQQSYDTVFGSGPQSTLYSTVPTYYTWSDHDFCGTDSHGTSTGHDSAVRAFRARVPVSPVLTGATDPIYYSFEVGRVRFIVTDLRSAQSAPPATDNTSKTKMGATQKTWFKNQLDQSILENQGKYFTWISEAPYHSAFESGQDHWGLYQTERTELANYIKAQGLEGRICIVSGDQHALAIDSGVNADYATGGGADIPVFQCGGLVRPASHKGGPYSEGRYPAIASGTIRGYGAVDVIDTGGTTLTIRLYAYTIADNGTPTLRLDPNADGISYEFTTASIGLPADIDGAMAAVENGSDTFAGAGGWPASGDVDILLYEGEVTPEDIRLRSVEIDEGSVGTGALSAQSAIVDGEGASRSSATGALAAQVSDITGSGTSASSGSGVLADQAADISGAELSACVGAGALAAQISDLTGIGASFPVAYATHMVFETLEDFWSDETGSQYVAGFQYTVREETLRDLVEIWESENKIKFVDNVSLERVKGWGFDDLGDAYPGHSSLFVLAR
jgi:alkaline phosphatase D